MVFFRTPQTFRHQVRGVRARNPPDAGGAQGAGQRLPPALLCVHPLPTPAQHWRRVLPHGGQQARVQE